MDSSLFDYDLPLERIAQEPSARREDSRLMVIDRKAHTVSHHFFRELPDLLPADSALFRNNAAVLKARLRGERPSGGKVECLLAHPAEGPDEWWCLIRPGKKVLRDGAFASPGAFRAEVLEQGAEGHYRVRFETDGKESIVDLAERVGELPLPPYIERSAGDERTALDNERYQTVYADRARRVAAAAPTAGLHFSEEVIRAVEARGGQFHDLTLHVGLGTFQPIKTETIEAHQIHSEHYEVPCAVFEKLRSRDAGLRVAVGTTAVRTMEAALRRFGGLSTAEVRAAGGSSARLSAEANLFLYPPATFSGVDAMITNFHLPRSTLLCLVSAFLAPGSDAGVAWLKEIYALAIAEHYRFYSYGDAMLIL